MNKIDYLTCSGFCSMDDPMYLIHYGTQGMHWGVRKADRASRKAAKKSMSKTQRQQLRASKFKRALAIGLSAPSSRAVYRSIDKKHGLDIRPDDPKGGRKRLTRMVTGYPLLAQFLDESADRSRMKAYGLS